MDVGAILETNTYFYIYITKHIHGVSFFVILFNGKSGPLSLNLLYILLKYVQLTQFQSI